MLCNATKVAAANCHALSPVSSHFGEGTSMKFSTVIDVSHGAFTGTAARRCTPESD
jgi:hypothetical protein